MWGEDSVLMKCGVDERGPRTPLSVRSTLKRGENLHKKRNQGFCHLNSEQQEFLGSFRAGFKPVFAGEG